MNTLWKIGMLLIIVGLLMELVKVLLILAVIATIVAAAYIVARWLQQSGDARQAALEARIVELERQVKGE